MEYAYLIIFVVVVLLSFVIVLSVLGVFSKKVFSHSKSNLAKKFLTNCYALLSVTSYKYNAQSISSFHSVHEDILFNFMNLLQKLFEGKFTAGFKVYQNRFVLSFSTEPFFPFISPISRLKQLLMENDLAKLVGDNLLKALHIDSNTHRIAIPNDISIFALGEVVEVCRELNVNSVVFVPVYRDRDISNVFVVFTNRFNISEEALTISNMLIDFVSVFLLYLANRRSVEDLLSRVSKGMLEPEEKIISCDMVVDSKTNNIIATTCDEETILQLKMVLDLNEIVKTAKRLGSGRIFKNYETKGGWQNLYGISLECLPDDKVKIGVSRFSYIPSEKIEDVLLRVSDMVDVPIVVVNKETKEIMKTNRKFREIFKGYEGYSNVQSLMSNMKYVSEDVVTQDGMVFTVKKILVEETDLEGIFFYPLQVANQRMVKVLYDEAIRIRKIMSSMNFYESGLFSKNLEVYARYRPSDEMVEVGGDFFILREFGKRSVVGVFDVSGHGLSAGFLASNVKNVLDKALQEGKAIDVVLEELNNFVFSLNESISDADVYSYVTGVVCDINTERMRAKFLSAGHKYGILLKEDGIVTLQDLLTPSKPVGMRKDQKFELYEMEISPDYRFFFYTDGIVELETGRGFQVDEAKIIDLIVFCKNLSIRDTVEEIFSYIKSLREARVKDDFVILGFRVKH
ncbi:MAG: PP2C family protein-serine/threonine phosphatase [Brevinematia bacterium]